MIKVYTKINEKISEERGLNSWAAKEVKGIAKPVCPTYLIKSDGTRIDTWDLSAREVYDLLSYELKNNSPRVECSEFLESLKPGLKFPLDGVLAFLELRNISKYPSIVSDVMTSFCLDTLTSASTIAKFNKECNGDYSSLVDQDLINVVKQMKINEMNKNKQHSSVRR